MKRARDGDDAVASNAEIRAQIEEIRRLFALEVQRTESAISDAIEGTLLEAEDEGQHASGQHCGDKASSSPPTDPLTSAQPSPLLAAVVAVQQMLRSRQRRAVLVALMEQLLGERRQLLRMREHMQNTLSRAHAILSRDNRDEDADGEQHEPL